MRYTRTLLLVEFNLSSSVLYTEKRKRERAKGERERFTYTYSQILCVKIQLKRGTLLHIYTLLYKNLTPFISYLLKQQARTFLLVIIHFALLAASFNSSCCYIGGYYRSRRTRRSPRGLNLLPRRTRTRSETLPGSSRPRNLHPRKTRCCCFFRRRTLRPGLSSRSRFRWRTSAL